MKTHTYRFCYSKSDEPKYKRPTLDAIINQFDDDSVISYARYMIYKDRGYKIYPPLHPQWTHYWLATFYLN